MRGMGSWGLMAALVLALAAGAGAANIWVVDNGSSFPPDFFSIQDAIDFASPGDTIVVKTAQTYTDAVLINKDNLTVVGAGDTEINPDSDSTCSNNSDAAVVIAASGVRFQGFHLRFDNADCKIGILVTGSDNSVVANWVDGTEATTVGDGIFLDGDSKRNIVLGNWVISAEDDAIETGSGSGWGHLIAYNVVSKAVGNGIRFQVRKVTVDYNVAVATEGDGIRIDSDAADQFKVTNNIALDNVDDDLDRASGATGTFKKNVFESCEVNDNPAPCPAF